jgi:hypothetical protein
MTNQIKMELMATGIPTRVKKRESQTGYHGRSHLFEVDLQQRSTYYVGNSLHLLNTNLNVHFNRFMPLVNVIKARHNLKPSSTYISLTDNILLSTFSSKLHSKVQL